MILIIGCDNGLPIDQNNNTPSARTDIEIVSSTYSDGAIIVFYNEPEESGFTSVEMTFTPEVSGVTQPVNIKAGEAFLVEPLCIAGLAKLSNGTEYTVTLKACYSDDTKSDGISLKITPHAGVEPPLNLTASEGIGSTDLSWSAPAENNWFYLELSFTPDEPLIGQPIVLGVDDVGCTIDGLTNGTEYSFSLKAVEFFGAESTPVTAVVTPQAAAAPPTVNAVSLSFIDKDFDDDEISGTCSIGMAADESGIEKYKLYWGQSATEKIDASAFAEIDKTGADIEHEIAENTTPPAGTTHILIYSSNSAGDCSAPVAAVLEDFVVTQEAYSSTDSPMSDILELNSNYYVTLNQDPDFYKWNGSDFVAVTITGQTWTDTPRHMTAFDNRIMFIAMDAAGNAQRLWEYFPATSTAQRVTNAVENCLNNSIYDGTFYFVMFRDTDGYCIYSYDGAGNVTLVFDPDTDSHIQSADIFCVYNNELLISGRNAENETQLYAYNGTTTVQRSSFPADWSFDTLSLAVNNGILYFLVNDGPGGNNLYSYDGSSVVRAADLKSSGNSIISMMGCNALSAYNGNILMLAGNGVDGYEFWQYDGITASLIHDFDTVGTGVAGFGGLPLGFTEFCGYLFMGAYLEGNGHQLYRYDANDNIAPIIDVNPVYNSSAPDATYPIAIFENDLIFTNNYGANYDYWRLSINGF